jgi:hypothetical protein
MQELLHLSSLAPVTFAVDRLACTQGSKLRKIFGERQLKQVACAPISTYHNLPKTQQNNQIRILLDVFFDEGQLQQGLCLSLDGEHGYTSKAYASVGIPPKNIVAISFKDGVKLSDNLKLTKLKDVRVLNCAIGTLLEHRFLRWPCVRSVFFDYTGSLNGRQSGNIRLRYCPKEDLRHFFKKFLPKTDGCLLFLTLGLVPFCARETLIKDVALARKLIRKFAKESYYVTVQIESYYYTSNRTQMHFMAFWIGSSISDYIKALTRRKL